MLCVHRVLQYTKPCKATRLACRHRRAARPPRWVGSSSASDASLPLPSAADERADVEVRLRGFPSMLDKEIFMLGIPALFTVLMDPLLGMVDTAIVGHLGAPVLAGVGLGAMISGIFNWIFGFLSTLTIPRVAGALANNDEQGAANHVAQAMWLAIAAGTMSTILSFTLAPRIIGGINGDPTMAMYSIAYIKWRCISCPFVLMQYVMVGAFRGMKDTRTPLVAAFIANLGHLGTNVLFVYVLQMSAAGAALSTALSQIVSSVILMYLMQRRKLLRWDLIQRGPKWGELGPFALEGAAVSLRTVAFTATLMFSSVILASVGTVAQAANEIIRQIWIVLIQVVESCNISNQSIMSSALFSGRIEYAKAVCKRHMLLSAALIAAASTAVIAFRYQIVGLFTSDPSVVSTAVTPLLMILMLSPLDALGTIMDGSLTAAGQAGWCAQTTIFMSLVSLGMFVVASRTLDMNLMLTWIILKFISMGRLPLLVHRTFFSRSSPFKAKTG